jgi:hypothetical protein
MASVVFRIKIKKEFNPNNIKIKETILKVANTWAFQTVNKIKLDASGNLLNVREGRLRNRITGKVKQTRNKTSISIGSNVIYAKVQDDKRNTTILPKTMQNLTVPVDRTVKGRARQYNNTFVIRSKKGNLLLVKTVGKGKKKKIKPLFILKKQVTIKGTGFITDNINNRISLLDQLLFLELNELRDN